MNRATPLTVAECLALRPLTEAMLVSGSGGLGRQVRWVHVVEVLEVGECLGGGELVLTCGVLLGKNREFQRQIIKLLDQAGAAGLGIAIGPYMDHIPEHLIEDADRYSMPLITIPWTVNFREIMRTLIIEIIQREDATLARSRRVHHEITQIVFEGGQLADLARRLSHLLARSVVIVDAAFQYLSGELREPASSELREVIWARQMDRNIVDRLYRAGLTHVSEHNPRLASVSLGESTLVVAPIVVGRRLHGYLWVDSDIRSLQWTDLMAIEHGATVAALIMYKEEVIRQAERRLERNVLDSLLDGEALDEKALERAERFGLAVHSPHVVMVARLKKLDFPTASQVFQTGFSQYHPGARIFERAGHVVIIVPCAEKESARKLALRLQAIWELAGERPTLGISAIAPGLASIAKAYSEARDALRIGELLDPNAGIYHVDDVSTLRQSLKALHLDSMTSSTLIARLAQYDAEHGTSLLHSLEVFLRHDGAISPAARALGVHRHTLLYRLSRLSEILGVELTPAIRLELRLGLLAYSLASLGSYRPR